MNNILLHTQTNNYELVNFLKEYKHKSVSTFIELCNGRI